MNKHHIIIFLILFSSCTSDDESVQSFEDIDCPINYRFNIDVDEDGIVDFNIFCDLIAQETIIGPGDRFKVLSIFPATGVYTLKKGNRGLFFFLPNDTIESDPSEIDLDWDYQNRIMILRAWYQESGWNDNWNVMSNLNEYYLPFKLKNGTEEKIGWIKFEIDTISGEITIVDKAYTTLDSIVIS